MSYNYFTPNYFGISEAGGIVLVENITVDLNVDDIDIDVEVEDVAIDINVDEEISVEIEVD